MKQKFTSGKSFDFEYLNLNITFFYYYSEIQFVVRCLKCLFTKSSVLSFFFDPYWYMVHYLHSKNGNNFCSESFLTSINMNNIINQKKKNGGKAPPELTIAAS